MKRRWSARTALACAAVLLLSLATAMAIGWTGFAARIDNYAYDFLFALDAGSASPLADDAVLLAIDDATFAAMGGVRRVRGILAEALERLRTAHPRAVAIDVLLHDHTDPVEDARLTRAMKGVPHLVLASDLTRDGWDDPLPDMAAASAAIGHVQADQDSPDGVTRAIPLERAGFGRRRWALALEAYRLAHAPGPLLESPADVQAGPVLIPAAAAAGRPLRIRYGTIPVRTVSVQDLPRIDPAVLRDKVVFLGVTSLSYTRDRVYTPARGPMPGLEVHAHAYRTIQRGRFLTDARDGTVLAICAGIALLFGLVFALLPGWTAFAAAAVLLVASHLSPWAAFGRGTVLPFFAVSATAWLSLAAAATFQHFAVQRRLRTSETERTRYRQAIQFVTHEMRSPLTAIQGSSELMGRYNLNDEKRREMARMINSESKRLARMIQTFLDVERLTDGQMEMKREVFSADATIAACIERVRPLADRKQIRVEVDGPLPGVVTGDRELLEYAIYNLLTNAVKYSPAATCVTVASRVQGGTVGISVRDQGIGLDAREIRRIFQRFYRTRSAEASGEKGTGIGLSLVEQIVARHGGRVDVTSRPGEGSCFTLVLPAGAAAGASVSL